MARVEDLKLESLTPEQKAIHDRIAGTRGGTVRGPFAIWLRNPKIADAADRFGTTLRNGDLDQRLFELMVLIVARHWSAQYEWYRPRPARAGGRASACGGRGDRGIAASLSSSVTTSGWSTTSSPK